MPVRAPSVNEPVLSIALPLLSISNAVDVAKPEVLVERRKRGVVPPAEPATERIAPGVVVPIP